MVSKTPLLAGEHWSSSPAATTTLVWGGVPAITSLRGVAIPFSASKPAQTKDQTWIMLFASVPGAIPRRRGRLHLTEPISAILLECQREDRLPLCQSLLTRTASSGRLSHRASSRKTLNPFIKRAKLYLSSSRSRFITKTETSKTTGRRSLV